MSPVSWIPTVLTVLALSPAAHGARYVSREIPRGPLVIVRADDAVPAVALTALVGAGAVDEGPGMQGASHFLEHLCFNGTESRSQEELYRETARLGLYSNAFTRRELTAYQMLGPSDRLEQMFELQADMLFRSTLPPEKFEKERGIVLEEIAKDKARGGGGESSAERFELEVLGAHAATGTAESIAALERADVLEYYRDRYRPGNVVLYVTGDIEPERAFRLARSAYRARGRSAPAVERAVRTLDFGPAGRPARRLEVEKGAAPRAWLVFPAPAPGSAHLVEAQVLARALQTAAESRLGSGSRAWLEVSERSPVLVLTAPGSAAELERRLEDALAPALDSEALRRAGRMLGAEELLQAEQPHYHAFYRAPLLAAGDLASLEALAALPASLDADSARRRAKELLGGPRLAVETRQAGEQADRQDAQTRPTSSGHPQTVASGAPSLAEAQDPPGGSPAELVQRGGRTLGRQQLRDGLLLRTESSGGAGVFALAVILRDKEGHERRWCLPGAAEVLHRAFQAGTFLRTRDEMAADLADMGAELKTVDIASLPYDDYALSPEYGYLRAKVPEGEGEALIRLVGEMLSWPRLDEETVARARRQAVEAVGVGRRGGREAAGQAFRQQVLGEDVWPPRGTSAGIERVDVRRLEAFARDYLAPRNLILSVVSSRPHAEVAALVEREWRTLLRGVGASPEGPVEGPCDPRFDPMPDEAAQVWMQLGQRIDAPEELTAALRAGNAWLSDRVAFVVRERLGLAYSVGTALRPEEAWFSVSLGTRPENVDRAAEAARRAVEEALAGPVDAADWEASVHGGLGRSLMRRLPSDNRAFQAGLAELEGRALGAAPEGESRASATPEEALEALRLTLRPADFRLAVGR